jgi:excisionase family DNA binding protein
MSDHISKRDAYRVMFTDYPDVVGIKQLCEMLGGISTKTCYKILRSGKIEYLRVGREYRIPKLNVLRYLKVIQDTSTPAI